MLPASRLRHGDGGETLVEILLTLVILAIAVTAIMFALATTLHVGSFNRTQGKASAVLATAGEYVRQQGFATCSYTGPTSLTTAQVPRDPAWTVTVAGPLNASNAPAGANPWPSTPCTSGLEAFKVTVSTPGDTGITLSENVARFCKMPMNGSTCPP